MEKKFQALDVLIGNDSILVVVPAGLGDVLYLGL